MVENLHPYTVNPPIIDKDELQDPSDLDSLITNQTLDKIRDALMLLWKHDDVQTKILSQYHYPPIYVLDSIH
jgi:hypothetical protein